MTAGPQNFNRPLERWLTRDWGVPVTVDRVEMTSAGARRTTIIFEATSGASAQRLVATIVPPGITSPIDVHTEAGVRSLAAAHGVPVPLVRSVCTDSAYLGGPFFVSEYVCGETVPRRVLRLAEGAGNGDVIVAQLGAALARLHAIDTMSAAAALKQQVPDTITQGTLSACRDAVANLPEPSPALAYAVRWLSDHLPSDPARVSLVHGDARVGNIVVDERGLRGILDWEVAHLGDPMQDIAFTCIRMWRFGNDANTVGGLSTLERYRSAYVEDGGKWDGERLHWWRVHETLKWALELGDQATAFLNRSVPSLVMAGSGRRRPETEYDLLLLTEGN